MSNTSKIYSINLKLFKMDLEELKEKYDGDISKISEEEWMYLSMEDKNTYECEMMGL